MLIWEKDCMRYVLFCWHYDKLLIMTLSQALWQCRSPIKPSINKKSTQISRVIFPTFAIQIRRKIQWGFFACASCILVLRKHQYWKLYALGHLWNDTWFKNNSHFKRHFYACRRVSLNYFGFLAQDVAISGPIINGQLTRFWDILG